MLLLNTILCMRHHQSASSSEGGGLLEGARLGDHCCRGGHLDQGLGRECMRGCVSIHVYTIVHSLYYCLCPPASVAPRKRGPLHG